MNHTRIGFVALALALGVGALAGPAAGQAANDKERICGQLQNRTPPVGSWASYTWTGGRTNGTMMRMAPGTTVAVNGVVPPGSPSSCTGWIPSVSTVISRPCTWVTQASDPGRP